MISAGLAVLIGLVLLIWSADRFVDGASATAWHAGVPSLLIGMVIVGLGTSAPELTVSAFAASQGNPSLALGNAYGSNIANIALILGLTALVSPIWIKRSVLKKEIPLLLLVTAIAAWQLIDKTISRWDALGLLSLFVLIMGESIWKGLRQRKQASEEQAIAPKMSLPKAILWLCIGLAVMVASSRLLVWGAVTIAQQMGISDLVIGLTIVAIGTSLPELASSLAASRKGEHELIIGNVLGSNLFNTLAVVGLAGVIEPILVDEQVLTRDCLIMACLTLSILVFGYKKKQDGKISRLEGAILLSCFLAYNGWLAYSTLKIAQ